MRNTLIYLIIYLSISLSISLSLSLYIYIYIHIYILHLVYGGGACSSMRTFISLAFQRRNANPLYFASPLVFHMEMSKCKSAVFCKPKCIIYNIDFISRNVYIDFMSKCKSAVFCKPPCFSYGTATIVIWVCFGFPSGIIR